MDQKSRVRLRWSFTLVEMLIVVLILGILAAIVIPMMSGTTEESKLSRMVADLALVRKQLEIYKLQHLGKYPTLDKFKPLMIGKSNIDGTTTGSPKLGPYIDRIPTNPFTQASDMGIGSVGDSSWYYDENTGEFRANCHAKHTTY